MQVFSLWCSFYNCSGSNHKETKQIEEVNVSHYFLKDLSVHFLPFLKKAIRFLYFQNHCMITVSEWCFLLIQTRKYSIYPKCRHSSDATECGVWSGSKCFRYFCGVLFLSKKCTWYFQKFSYFYHRIPFITGHSRIWQLFTFRCDLKLTDHSKKSGLSWTALTIHNLSLPMAQNIFLQLKPRAQLFKANDVVS